MNSSTILIRKARMGDVKAMHQLLNRFADKRELLPRSIAEVYENLQQFHVAEHNKTIIGTCALYVTWDNLAEVKALAVEEKYQGRGIGRSLLDAAAGVARDLHIRRLFTLTIRTGFFEHFGFKHVSKDHLPHKVWTECVKCVFFPDRCVEYAMVKDLSGPGPTPPPIVFREKVSPSKELPAGTLMPSEPLVPGVSTPSSLSKKKAKK
jgi:amino-acid N-acetyltransferase